MNHENTTEQVKVKRGKGLYFVLFCSLIILASFSAYLILMKKTMINPMEYANVSIIGYGEKRELSVQARANNEKNNDEKKVKNLPELLAILKFSADKTKNVKNGDIVEIKLVTKDEELERLGYSASLKNLTYTVSGLVELPKSWEDIPQKDQIIVMAEEQIEHKRKTIIEYYAKKSEEINGVSINIELIPGETSIYLENGGKICSPKVARVDNCAKVNFIQRFDVKNNSNFSFSIKTMYIISGISNIYIDEDGSLSPIMYIDDPASINSDSAYMFQDLDAVEKLLFESGFLKQ